MNIEKLPYSLTVCKVNKITDIDISSEFFFIGKTDEELSLVCRTEDTPHTDYILVKEDNFEKALAVLASAGYEIVQI